MTDEQTVAIIAAILFVGEVIDARLNAIEADLSHTSADEWSGIGFDEAVARARELLNIARTRQG